jgi:hypothetical protein
MIARAAQHLLICVKNKATRRRQYFHSAFPLLNALYAEPPPKPVLAQLNLEDLCIGIF